MIADLSRARRRWALSALRSTRASLADLGPREQLVYAVGLLASDDRGTFDVDQITAAMAEPLTVQVAEMLLSKAGWLAGRER